MNDGRARLLVIIPAFNEEAGVGAVIAEVRSRVPAADVMVIDDGSADATAARAEAAGAIVARLPFNLGVGGAMRTGFRYAAEHDYDVAVQVDADGQHDPASIPELLTALSEPADIVIGARFAGAGNYRVRGPRAWAMRLFAAVLSRSARTRLTDTTSGFKASGRRAIALFAEEYPAEYLGDTLEALVIATRAGLVVRQVPVEMRPRVTGTPSHNPIRAAVYLGRASMALIVAYLRPRVRMAA